MIMVTHKFDRGSRVVLLAAVGVATLAGCSLLKRDKAGSGIDKSGRISLSALEQKIEADPTLATTNVALPAINSSTDWPQAGRTPSKLTGNVHAGAALTVDWKRAAGAGSNLTVRLVAPPVARDGHIYVLDADQHVSAFATSDGHKLWTQALKSKFKLDRSAIGGGLALSGDRLIVASGFGFVAALSLADGKEIWRRRAESPVSGAPAVLANRAFVTSTNNELYALDVATGDVIWSDQAIAESARVLSAPSPAVSDELLATPYSSGEIVAYIPANGRRLWADTLTTVGQYTPLSVINDIAGRPVIEAGVVYAASYSGVLTAIDARSGQRIWARTFGSRLGPVISGDFLFAVGTDGQVICLEKADGKAVWVRQLSSYKKKKKNDRLVWTGPLLADGRLIVVSSDGDVVALSPQTGKDEKHVSVGEPIYIDPIAADGKIFVLTDKGRLVAIR